MNFFLLWSSFYFTGRAIYYSDFMHNIETNRTSCKPAPAHALIVGEGFVNPIGFHDSSPSFSWKLPKGTKQQTAYWIEVSGDGVRWESGRVDSEQSLFVPYGGSPLNSRQQLKWRVKLTWYIHIY